MLRTIEFYLIIKYYMGKAHIISNIIWMRHMLSGRTRMLQVYVLNILAISKVYVASVLSDVAYITVVIHILHPSQNICRFRFPRNNFDKIYIKKY